MIIRFFGKIVAGIAASIGTVVTGIAIWSIATDRVFVETRLDGLLVLTAIPLMYMGFYVLRSIWQEEALSEKKEIDEIFRNQLDENQAA